MAKEVKIRRGSNAEHATFTGAVGELTYNTDTGAIHTHDGVRVGGFAGGGYLPAGTGAVATDVQSKLRESVSVKDFGAVGDGTNEAVKLLSAMAGAAAANKPLDLCGLNIRFSGNIPLPTAPALRGMFNGTLTSLGTDEIIFGMISLGQYENLIINALVRDDGLRDSRFERVYAKRGWIASCNGRDVLYNHYDTCEFGFDLTAGVSFDISAPSVGNNPFSANTFTSCKFKGGVGVIPLDSTNSTANVRGNVWVGCDMSTDAIIMKHGATFGGNLFIGGYYELGGVFDFSIADRGNRLVGGRADNSTILGMERLEQCELSAQGRISFAHFQNTGSNLSPQRKLNAQGSTVPGWLQTNATVSNDATAPAGFSGASALKVSQTASGTSRIYFSIPPDIHTGLSSSIVLRVYVPTDFAGDVTLHNGNTASPFSSGIALSKTGTWVTIAAQRAAYDNDSHELSLTLRRLGTNDTVLNRLWIDWAVVSTGLSAPLAAIGAQEHHFGTLTHYGDLRLSGALGVGNSVVATETIGKAVTRKIQVYDASGASLGFVPVYSSIT